MKAIHYLNTVTYTLFLILIIGSYLLSNKTDTSGWFIIMFHIVLGALQPFLALIISVKLDWSNTEKVKHIGRYCATLILFLILVCTAAYLEFEWLLKALTLIPFCIATYFIFVTYKYQKQ